MPCVSAVLPYQIAAAKQGYTVQPCAKTWRHALRDLEPLANSPCCVHIHQCWAGLSTDIQ